MFRCVRWHSPVSLEMDMEPIVTSITETAKALSVGRTMVYKLIAEGRLETVHFGRRQLVKTASIRALVEQAN
jgi:excisionase family DNA binding protein